MDIAVIAGTRPEVIKLAPIHSRIAAQAGLASHWISTAQQTQLNSQMLEAFGVVPALSLDGLGEGSVAGRLSQAIAGLDGVLRQLKPDMVLVQGDTTSTVAGALATFALGIPVAHVEAGLRTGDLASPFPEEGWRRVVGQIAELHFAPTRGAADNLLAEGIAPGRIQITGNTGADALLDLLASEGGQGREDAGSLRRVLVTLHRREAWAQALDSVLDGLIGLRDAVADIQIDFVLHANPALRERVSARLAGQDRITLFEPLPYPDFVRAMAASRLILSDSGGVQEEAPVLGVPLLVLRDTTERPEAVEGGFSRLIGTDGGRIVAEARTLLENEAARKSMIGDTRVFGDGQASRRILSRLLDWKAGVRDRPDLTDGPWPKGVRLAG